MQQSTPIPQPAAQDPLRRSIEVIFLKDVAPTADQQRWKYWPLIILLAITAIGAAIRFMFLERPCLWGDEALVYWRICGKYPELLIPLQSGGFGPLHYELDWLIGHYIKPTPTVLRLVPAICGTLMIPTIYFLSRQLLQRSTSLLAAAFTACSGFLIFYSRDAKMYSDTWLYVALNAACLLWWFRSHRMTAWLCWIAAGCAACGTHASAMAVVGLSPVLFLTQQKVHWRQTILLVIGLAVIFAGPVGYYFNFNHWMEEVDDRGWRASGIDWVDQVNRDLTGPELVRYTATSFLMGWNWPRLQDEPRIAPWLVKWPKVGAEILAGILVLSLLPWPLMLRPGRDIDPPPEPQWRVLLWMGFWILIPGYAMYCHSMRDFVSPIDWYRAIVGAIPVSWATPLNGRPLGIWAVGLCIVFAYIVGLCIKPSRPGFLRGLQWIGTAIALLGICEGIYKICYQLSLDAIFEGRTWHSIWQPRYLGFIWPALALTVATLIMRLPIRLVRSLAIVMLLGMNLGFGLGRIFGHTEPPVDQMAADTFASQAIDSHTRTYTNITIGGPTPGFGTLRTEPGRYYMQMNAWLQPMSPERFSNLFREFMFRNFYSPGTIAEEVTNTRFLTRVVVWDELNKRSSPDDSLSPLLRGWSLTSETRYPLRTFWDWVDITQFRRREYTKDIPGRVVIEPPIPSRLIPKQP